MIKFLLSAIVVAIIAICANNVLQLKTASSVSSAIKPKLYSTDPSEIKGAIDRFSRSIQYETILQERDHDAFVAFREEFLPKAFPRVHATLSREVVGNNSLLYRWQGADDSLRPVALLGHFDVVPAPEPEQWTHPPFSGFVDNTFVWGRGTLDDKVAVMSILEAVEHTLFHKGESFKPQRTVYLAFGSDEEIGGTDGAAQIAALLKSRGIQLDLVVDEGGVVLNKMVDMISQPMAVIGLAEKGMVNLRLTLEADGGHASQPKRPTNIARLAAAVARVESGSMPSSIRSGVARSMLDALAPYVPFGIRVLLANNWLFAPILDIVLSKTPSMNAVLRTTITPTIFNSGQTANVIPRKAEAILNVRISPSDSYEDVRNWIIEQINDPDIVVTEEHKPNLPSSISCNDCSAYRLVEKTIMETTPDAIVIPYLMIAGTDSKHYRSISDQVYLHFPMRLDKTSLNRIHGVDERIEKTNYVEVISYWYNLIHNLSLLGSSNKTKA